MFTLELSALGIGLLLSVAPAHAKSVGVYSPGSEVIVFARQGFQIHIRVCQKYALKSEIESSSSCLPAARTADVVLMEKSFRALISERMLGRNDSPENKRILTKKANSLNARVKRLKEYRDENFQFDIDEKKLLEENIDSLEKSVVKIQSILTAKVRVSKFVDGLLADISSDKLQRRFDFSGVRGNLDRLAFKALKNLALVAVCEMARFQNERSGSVCRAGSALWQVCTQNFSEIDRRIFTDLTSGL